MWLGLPILIVIALALLGGIVVGGVYLVVVIPVAIVVVIGVVLYAMANRRPDEGVTTTPVHTENPLPHSEHRNVAAAPSAPSDLVDARRRSQ